jgi:Domain of unknown function (DUF4265)
LKKRIYFELDPLDWHGAGSEGIWAEPVKESTSSSIYRLLNSPFYARGVSYLDIVRAVPRADEGVGLQFAEVIEHSGHSTYMILVLPQSLHFNIFWRRLEVLGCTYEPTGVIATGFGQRELYSVDVPTSSDVHAVYSVLEDGERDNIWVFQEGHCGHITNKNQRQH